MLSAMCHKYDMQHKKFSTFDLSKGWNIPRSSIQQYIDRGLIRPSLGTARGKGTRNKFSLADVYRFRLFQKLHEAGLSQKEASENANHIDFAEVVTSFDWGLIMPEKNSKTITVCDEEKLHQFMHEWRGVLFIAINLSKIKEEVDKKLNG